MSDSLQSLAARTLCLVALSLAVTPVTALAQSPAAGEPAPEQSRVKALTAPPPVGLVTGDAAVARLPTAVADDSLSLAHVAETTLFPEIPVLDISLQDADSTAASELDVGDAVIGAIFFAVASLWIALR